MTQKLLQIFSPSLAALLLCLGLLTGCSDDDDSFASDHCRLSPEACLRGAGALCVDDGDCAIGLMCCTDNDNCGDGMCTLPCRKNEDCPLSMRCEHDLCFYACNSDEDCAPTMSCEHGKTICEYEK